MLSLPAAISRKKPITISCSSSALAVDLGVDEDAGQVVGGVLATLGDQRLAALEDLGHVLLHDQVGVLAVAGHVGIAGPERRCSSAAPRSRRPAGGMPMKLPITRETTGWATSSTRSQVSRPASPSRTPTVIARIVVLVLGDPTWG